MKSCFLTVLFVFVLTSAFSQFSPDSIQVRKGLATTFRQHNKVLKPKELINITSGNTEAAKEMKIAKQNYDIAQVISIPGGFLVGFPIGTALAGGDANWTLAAIGAGLIAVSVPFSSAYAKRATRAARLYNQSLDKPNATGRHELKFGLTANGVGFTVSL